MMQNRITSTWRMTASTFELKYIKAPQTSEALADMHNLHAASEHNRPN